MSLDPRLEQGIEDAEHKYRAIRRAADELRRAIASGQLSAFGCLGPAKDSDTLSSPRRTKLSRELFDVPVTIITLDGGAVWPYLQYEGPECGYEKEVTCHALLFEGCKIQEVWPNDPNVEYDLTPKAPPPNTPRRGGRPATHNWDEFTRELTLFVGLDGGNVTRLELRKHMKEWAAVNWKAPPDERTIERKLDDLVSPQVYTD